MAEFFEMSQESICQEKLQKLDKDVIPYDILGWCGDDVDPLPSCLTAMDYVFSVEKME